MDGIYLEIRNPDSAISFLAEAKAKTGMLKDVELNDIRRRLADVRFPIRIQINPEGLLDLCGNPVLKKMFGQKVERTTRKYIRLITETG